MPLSDFNKERPLVSEAHFMVGVFRQGKVPTRKIDYSEHHASCSVKDVATRPGYVFTRNSQNSNLFPERIYCERDCFWIEYGPGNVANFMIPIPDDLPQRDQLENMQKTIVPVSLETTPRMDKNPTMTFMFIDTAEGVDLHIETRDCFAAKMELLELAQMHHSKNGIPYRYLAKHEGRPFIDMLKYITLTERYYFHGIKVTW